ncbi:hypothetical protein F2P56_006344 [Juglans regia]|uniref:Uncharacterized protein n=1 Tax=Juglans regia TaxID=51240 RepID=A0A834D1V2_JUGRE|nr:hypothetical protein F2P56_006344 [Juglans regia]
MATSGPLEHEIPNGWPLGLGIVNIRLRVVQSLPAAGIEPHSLHMQSSSFSSFSSSNLDTESTASFFQDQSVSLGRLIGLRPGERRSLYMPKSIPFKDHDTISKRDAPCDVPRGGGQRVLDILQGICIPLLTGALEKISRSKSKSRKS